MFTNVKFYVGDLNYLTDVVDNFRSFSLGALTALSSVSTVEEPRAFRPVRGHRLESPQLSPAISPVRSPTR